MILVGIDDTDMPGTPGTNQLARKLTHTLSNLATCRRIVRHQLCTDPSIPCTSQNGSASLLFEPGSGWNRAVFLELLRGRIREHSPPGSDPGLCYAEAVPESVEEFGRRAKQEVVTQADAHQLAVQNRILLEGLGGTNGGVIGALAAVGLAAGENDGRIVHLVGWPDDLTGIVDVAAIHDRGVEVRDHATRRPVNSGRIDLVKKLRPNLHHGRAVLFVEAAPGSDSEWQALKLP